MPEVLQPDVQQSFTWTVRFKSKIHVLSNVLCCEGEWLYTDGMPPEELMNKLQTRNDKQIMSLEVMAISLGLRTFAKELKGRRVLVYAQPSRKCTSMHFNVAGKQ